MLTKFDIEMLDFAQRAAESSLEGCLKVRVGAVICNASGEFCTYGVNDTIPEGMCKSKGCFRIERYGDNDKTHRAPSDCRAIHAEIDAIAACAAEGIPTFEGTIYVTRYPCENCARAIVAAGFKRVVYGCQQEISEYTKEIFESGNIEVVWAKNWTAFDANN